MVNLYNNIPQYVKENGLFCCWKYEERKGKQSKVPYNALTDKYASSDKPETFTDFEKACSAAAEGNYDGIGLGIFGDICAIDIDDCIPEKGKLTKLANDVVAMMQSYAEVSPSGKGVRILFQPKDFPYDKDKSTCVSDRRLILTITEFFPNSPFTARVPEPKVLESLREWGKPSAGIPRKSPRHFAA